MHTYIHTYIHTYVRTYIHTYTHTYIHTYIHACIHTHIWAMRNQVGTLLAVKGVGMSNACRPYDTKTPK